MAIWNSMIWIALMNHNENENFEYILNVYFHRFVNVVHENLWYVIDEYVIFQLD
jgi:hypothetical protein